MTASRDDHDAFHYWRQFPVTVHFQEPDQKASGVLIDLQEIRSRDEYLPKLRLQQKDGQVLIVVVSQTRLLAELNRLKPAKGDWLKIVYHGEAKKSAPGMNPTKEFTVEVVRRGDIPSATTDPTAARGTAVDAPGPDPGTAPTAPTVDGPTPPASTSGAAVPGPGPDETPAYVTAGGRVHVPERPDVTKVKERIAALTPLEKEAFRGWLTKAKIPDSIDVSEAKVRTINAELDRRAAQPSPASH